MKKFLILLSIVFLSSNVSLAEKITWKQIVDLATKNNPQIQAAQLKLDNAKLAYLSAFSGYLPSVSLSGSTSQGETEKNFSRSYSYGISANYTVFEGFANFNEIRLKSMEVDAAQSAYDRTVSDVAYEIANQYINLMCAYESLELQNKIYERRKVNKDMINLKYNSGNVDLGSLKRVEADVETAAFDIRKAQRNIETMSASLRNAIGIEGEDILETDERLIIEAQEISKPDFANLILTIPEYLIASCNTKSSKMQAAISKSKILPTVNLSGSINRSDNKWMPDRQSWNAGLSISYLLFNGGKRYADIKTASNNYKVALENFKNISNSLKANAVAKYNNLLDAIENIKIKEDYLQASKLQAEISNNKYINGLATYQDWYSIENDFINSQKTLLETKKTAAIQKAGWNNFIGKGFVEPGN